LPAGNYGLRVEATGFTPRERIATVEVGTGTRVDFLLKIGATTDTVQVEEAAPQMNYESNAVAGVVTRTQIQDLPLNGRSFLNLASIEPGVSVGATSTLSQYNSQFAVSILGGSSGRTAYTVDGGNVRDDIENTGPSQNFSQEVVQEFQVNSTNFDLSTGITSVGSINVVTRSGGNKFHGSAYFYFRDHNMAAYPGLQRNALNPNPFFARRNPGFWLSGPIKKDKLFFFFNYEHQNQASAVTFLPTQGYPSIAGLVGNFLTPYVGTTLSAKFDYRLSSKHTLFARYSHDGNSSTGPQSGPALPSNWTVNANWSDLTTLGVTSTFTPTLVNDFRFNYQYWHNRNLFPDSSCATCLGTSTVAGESSPEIAIGSTNITIGHNLNATQGRDLRQFQYNDTMSWIKGNHRIRFGGEIQFTPGTGFWGYCDPICSQVASPELIKASFTGANAAAIPLYFPKLPATVSTYADFLNLPFEGASIGIGDPSQPPPYRVDTAKNNNRFHLFAQDTWKIRPNFTLNYGLAWSFESNLLNFDMNRPAYLAPLYGSDLTPPNNNDHNFSPSIGFNWSPWKNNKTTVHGGFGIYYDTAQLYQRLQERSEIGPVGNGRIVEPQTAILNTLPGIINFATGKPLAVGAPITTGLFNMTLGQFLTMEEAQIGAVTAALSSSAAGAGITTIDIAKSGTDLYAKNYPVQHSIQFNLGFQREVKKDLVLTVDYVRRVFLNVDLGAFDFNHYNRYINGVRTPVIPVCSAAQASTPGVECSNGAITFWNPGGRNVYNGFLAKLDKRFASHYQFTASWSLSRTSGYGSLYNQDNWNSSWESGKWGQFLNVVGTYDAKWGFTFSSITALGGKGSGDITVANVDLTGSGVTTTPLPGLSLGCVNNGCSQSDIVSAVNNWNTTYAGKFDARCGSPTGAGCTPIPKLQVPTNFFFGRPYFSQDLRVTKTFKLHSEVYKLAIFGEAFNIFNYQNLGGASTQLDPTTSATGFGIPTSRAGQTFGSGGPRAFQVGGRFSF